MAKRKPVKVVDQPRVKIIEDRPSFVKAQTVEKLIEESKTDFDFYFRLVVSTLVITLGLLLDSPSVVIGGMLIAPLLYPILALGLALVTVNHRALLRSSLAILKSMGIVILLSFFTAFLVGVKVPLSLEITQRIQPSLLWAYVAVLSGVGATFAWAKPKISESLPGIAVSVALLPPLSVTGIGISLWYKQLVTGSLHLFLLNLIGIAASSAIVFSLLGFYRMRWVEWGAIAKEQKEEQEGSKEV